MYPIFSFQNIDLRELLEEYELMYEEYLFDSVGLELIDTQHNFRSIRRDFNSELDFLTVESLANSLSFRKGVMKPVAYSPFSSPALRFCHWSEMLSIARKEE